MPTKAKAHKTQLPDIEVRWELAACDGMDCDLFFDQSPIDEVEARAICWLCPIRPDCLTWALTVPETYGMWGGLTEKQRKNMQVPRHRARCPGCRSFDIGPSLSRPRVEICSACGLSWSV